MPWSIEQAPAEIVAAFLRGLFDADGCAVSNPSKGSYVGLGSISIELLRGVQRLLSTFGISSRIYKVKSAGSKSLTYERKDGSAVTYSSKASFDLRITGRSMRRYAAEIGFSLSRKTATLSEAITDHEVYDVDTSIRLVDRIDEGIELTYNLSEPRNHSYVVNGVVVRNCSEYFHVDNSACNLASINLLKYLQDDGGFDVGGVRAHRRHRCSRRRRSSSVTPTIRPRRSVTPHVRSVSSVSATPTSVRCSWRSASRTTPRRAVPGRRPSRR